MCNICIEDWLLCILQNISKPIYDDNNIILWFTDWVEKIKYKVNLETWLLEEVKEN